MNRKITGIIACALVCLAPCGMLLSCATQKEALAARESDATVASADTEYAVEWTDEAAAAFSREVPKMVQKVARKGAEKKARAKGLHVIDMEFYAELKKEMNK